MAVRMRWKQVCCVLADETNAWRCSNSKSQTHHFSHGTIISLSHTLLFVFFSILKVSHRIHPFWSSSNDSQLIVCICWYCRMLMCMAHISQTHEYFAWTSKSAHSTNTFILKTTSMLLFALAYRTFWDWNKSLTCIMWLV